MKSAPASGEIVGNNDIKLVPIQLDRDVQQIFELANEDAEYIFSFDLGTGYFSSLESTYKHVQSMCERGIAFSILAYGQMAGNVYITESNAPEMAAISYWISKRFAQQGIGTEAVRQAVDFAFSNMGKAGLLASAALNNQPSVSILNKIGFMPFQRQSLEVQGGPVEIAIFGLINPEYDLDDS